MFAKLHAHAPEYLRDPESGLWHMTSAGWPGERYQSAIPGSVAIRPLEWA